MLSKIKYFFSFLFQKKSVALDIQAEELDEEIKEQIEDQQIKVEDNTAFERARMRHLGYF